MEVSDLLHASATLPPSVNPLVPIAKEVWVGPRVDLEAVEKRKSLASAGN
jgi:hypothetical protein